MAEIKWTEEAYQWLKDIYDYICRDNPAAATNAVSGLYKKVQFLRQFPTAGYKYI